MADKENTQEFNMKRCYPARFNGHSNQWSKTETSITTWAQKRDADNQLIATEKALEGRSDNGHLMTTRMDIINGLALMTSKPTPPTSENTTDEEKRAYLEARYRHNSLVSITQECREMFLKVVPPQFHDVHRNTMKSGPIHEIFDALKARYEAKSSDGMMEQMRRLFRPQTTKTTMAKHIDQVAKGVTLVNDNYQIFMTRAGDNGANQRPVQQLLSPTVQNAIVLMGLSQATFTALECTPEQMSNVTLLNQRLIQRTGTIDQIFNAEKHDNRRRETVIAHIRGPSENTYGGNAGSAARGRGGGRGAGRGGGRGAGRSGRGNFAEGQGHSVFNNKRPRVDPRDASGVDCHFCHEFGHFMKPSRDHQQPGCPHKKQWDNVDRDRLVPQDATRQEYERILKAYVDKIKPTVAAMVRGTTQDDGFDSDTTEFYESGTEAGDNQFPSDDQPTPPETWDDEYEARFGNNTELKPSAVPEYDPRRVANQVHGLDNIQIDQGFASEGEMDLPGDTTESDMDVDEQEDGQLFDDGNVAPARSLSPTRFPVGGPHDFDADDNEFGPATEVTKVASVRQSRTKMTSPNLTTQWCVDSGSGRSVCTSLEWLTWTEAINNGHQLLFPNGQVSETFTSGLASLNVLNKFLPDSIVEIPNCLLTEQLDMCILSEHTLLAVLGFNLSVSPDGRSKTYTKGYQCLVATEKGGIYYITATPTKLTRQKFRINLLQSFSYDELVKELRRQHLRLGHCHATVLARFVSSGRIESLPSMNERTILTILEKSLECQMCIKHKTMRTSYKRKVGSRPLLRCHTLHSDTKGPYSIKGCFNGTHGMIHLLVVSDDATSYKWVYFLKRLSDAPIRLIQLLKYLKRQFQDTPVKRLRADGHSVFKEGRVKAFCRDEGIQTEYSHPYCQEENGSAERYNRTLMETTRILLDTSNVPDYLWPEAASYANDMLNRRATRRLAPLSPHEAFGLGIPNVNRAFTFGSIGFCHIPVKTRRSHLECTNASSWDLAMNIKVTRYSTLPLTE